MGLLLMLLIFASPIGQIFMINKRLKGNTQISIITITMSAILSTIALSLIGLALYAVEAKYSTVIIKCDMTIPGVIGLDMLLSVFVMPAIGIVGGCLWNSKNKGEIAELKDNPYLSILKNSRSENLKRGN